ncbi:MAG: hypothetical protein MHPSP_000560, partial [Paramarteilia canceri]
MIFNLDSKDFVDLDAFDNIQVKRKTKPNSENYSSPYLKVFDNDLLSTTPFNELKKSESEYTKNFYAQLFD